jgi:hypothetical protein
MAEFLDLDAPEPAPEPEPEPAAPPTEEPAAAAGGGEDDGADGSAQQAEVRKTPPWSHFTLKMIILPSQARDKPKETSKTEAYSAGGDSACRVLRVRKGRRRDSGGGRRDCARKRWEVGVRAVRRADSLGLGNRRALLLLLQGWRRVVVPAPVNISVKRLKFRLSGSARKSQKRFRDTPMFNFQAVLARIQPFQRSNERSERGDHSV